jgi:predicted alpha/beta-hydrolase family hydrolase
VPEAFRVDLPNGNSVAACRYAAEGDRFGATLVLAHGAGAPHTHPFMVGFGCGLAARGIDVVTFNFPYMEARRRVPDRPPVLEDCYLAAIAHVRALDRLASAPLFIGGKSMGGRMASHVAAHHPGTAGPLSGLVFLGYPLHPPGRPDERRDAHLASVAAPMLFVQGSRDAFGTPDELCAVIDRLGRRAELLVVENGDHSFDVPRGGSVSHKDVYARTQDAVAEWVRRHAHAPDGRSSSVSR